MLLVEIGVIRIDGGSMSEKKNMDNFKVGRLVVLHESHKRGTKGEVYYTCKCNCGNITEVRGSSLRNGRTQSCGCLREERSIAALIERSTTHGMKGTPIYNKWSNMKG